MNCGLLNCISFQNNDFSKNLKQRIVAQLVVSLISDTGLTSMIPLPLHTFVEIDNQIFSLLILLFLTSQFKHLFLVLK